MVVSIMIKNHTHKYKFDCKMAGGHVHNILGYTENTIGIGSFHLHFFYGTSFYTNHTHYFSGITGLPVKTENGHIHRMQGVLELNDMHEHDYEGYTFEEVSYASDNTQSQAVT